jgi:translocator protein
MCWPSRRPRQLETEAHPLRFDQPLPKRVQVFGLIAWLAVCSAASVVGAIGSLQAGTFYTQLIRPAWAPPPWIFGPVWTLLYILMGIAAWFVWRQQGFGKARAPLTLFLLQLVFNAVWSWLFFSWQDGALAFFDILVLWCLIVATIVTFWRRSPLAGSLLLPYWLWVSFASGLNYSIWQLNLTVLG